MDTCIALHLHPLHPTIVGAVAGAVVSAQWGAVGSSIGAVVRALAFHQCGPGSTPGPDVICGLSLLILYSAPSGFSPGTPVFPSHQKPTFDLISVNFIWFSVSPISRASVPSYKYTWDMNKVIIIVRMCVCKCRSEKVCRNTAGLGNRLSGHNLASRAFSLKPSKINIQVVVKCSVLDSVWLSL